MCVHFFVQVVCFCLFFYFYKTSVCPGKVFLEFLYHLSPVTNRIKTFHLSRAMFLSRLSFVSYWSRCYWWHRHIVQQRITTTIVFTSDLLRQQDEHWYFSSDIFFRCSFDTFYSKLDHPFVECLMFCHLSITCTVT